MKRPVYSRLEQNKIVKVQEFAESSGQSTSAALEELVSRGLTDLESGGKLEPLEQELSTTKEELQKLRQRDIELAGRLEVCQKNESLAHSAQQQAEANESQFRQILAVGVATCGRKGCAQLWRLYDVWLHRCPKCGNPTANLLPHYKPAPSGSENAKDLLAVVGGVAAVAAILKAMGGESDKA